MTRHDNDDGAKEAYKYAKETRVNTSLWTYSIWEFTGDCGDDSARQRRWRKRGETWLIPDVCETWRMHTCETKRLYSYVSRETEKKKCETKRLYSYVSRETVQIMFVTCTSLNSGDLNWRWLTPSCYLERCARTHLCVWHDSFTCVTWLATRTSTNHVCPMHKYTLGPRVWIRLFWVWIRLFWVWIRLFWVRIRLFWVRIRLFWVWIRLFWVRIRLFWVWIRLY